MKLYDYWRSTSSYRLRIAMKLKGVTAERHPVHLVRGGGEHHSEAYLAINPQARLPSLVLDDGTVLIRSPAFMSTSRRSNRSRRCYRRARSPAMQTLVELTPVGELSQTIGLGQAIRRPRAEPPMVRAARHWNVRA